MNSRIFAAVVVLLSLTQSLLAREITVTAYCPCKKCCGPNAVGLTTSGKKVKVGMAAATKDFKLGSRITLFENIYTIEDRMSKRYASNRVDIFFTNHFQARQFGVKKVVIKD
jgi:3D (Asp-Asp-Asp) domain-containing protein